jgi:hypothetical protein
MTLAFRTRIGISEVFLIDTLSQHPFQIPTLIALETLKNYSTAAGVTSISEPGIVVPSTVIATEIAPTVSPVGTAMFAPKSTR